MHAERASEIFLLFSCADTVVKARMATRKVLPELMQATPSPARAARVRTSMHLLHRGADGLPTQEAKKPASR